MSAGALLDMRQTLQYVGRFRDLLATVEGGSMICFTLNDFGDYFTFVLFYKMYEAWLRTFTGKRPVLFIGGALLYYLDRDQMMERFSCLDCAVVGPGERVFVDLLEKHAAGKDLPKTRKGESIDR